MINKELILKTIDLVEQIDISSIITIAKDDEVLDYKLNFDEFGDLELTCTTENDTIWNDYDETLEQVRIGLICDAVRGHFEDIKLKE